MGCCAMLRGTENRKRGIAGKKLPHTTEGGENVVPDEEDRRGDTHYHM